MWPIARCFVGVAKHVAWGKQLFSKQLSRQNTWENHPNTSSIVKLYIHQRCKEYQGISRNIKESGPLTTSSRLHGEPEQSFCRIIQGLGSGEDMPLWGVFSSNSALQVPAHGHQNNQNIVSACRVLLYIAFMHLSWNSVQISLKTYTWILWGLSRDGFFLTNPSTWPAATSASCVDVSGAVHVSWSNHQGGDSQRSSESWSRDEKLLYHWNQDVFRIFLGIASYATVRKKMAKNAKDVTFLSYKNHLTRDELKTSVWHCMRCAEMAQACGPCPRDASKSKKAQMAQHGSPLLLDLLAKNVDFAIVGVANRQAFAL